VTRLLPRSLGGQFATLLIMALLFAHLVSLALFFDERGRVVRAAIRFGVVEKVSTLVQVFDDTTPELGQRLATALSNRRTRLEIAERSSLPPDGMSEREEEFAEELADALSIEEHGPRARFTDRPPRRDEGWMHRHHRAFTGVEISIPLAGGRWLNATSVVRAPPIGLSWPWLVSLGVSAIATLLVAALLVRRITGPMRELAAAAEKIGRGEAIDPVPAKGPSEIRTTVEAFNVMQERLSRFVRDRTRMVAAISHDLRTPITSLRLRAEFIEDADLKRDVVRTLDEMQAMADATLAFAREEGAGEATRSVDVAALIDGFVEDMRGLGKDVSYEGPERLVWRCRPVSLKRALANLVENAVRYAGAARIGLAEEAGELRITVEDDGPGIPATHLEEVFEPFVRVETSRSRETGGVGLGLSIARSIVRAHGGELTLTNRQTGGLAATISLP